MMAVDHVFRLLVPADQDTLQDAPSIKVDGRRWVPTSYTQVPKPENTLAYTCISYSWGMETAPHPFEPRKVSSRAIPALEAVIRSLQPSAIWLDALCVPPDEPGRESNGDFSFIYCVGRRNGEPGRRWRPLPGSMRTLSPWHTFGDGQRGSLELDFLRLHEMCAVSPEL